ncbi:unnamed protein product [Effrenium voratum]|nr:unnamed protein product [Effrenium voratum]
MNSFTERAAARFDGKFLNDVFFIEVFCGTSRLTACVRAGGLPDSFGVDHKIHKQAKSPVVKLDLVQNDQLALLWSFVEDPACAGVHLAPPCGTSSRAREIVLEGRKAPRPLRNETCPDGIPSLQGSEKVRVFQANHHWRDFQTLYTIGRPSIRGESGKELDVGDVLLAGQRGCYHIL